MCQHHFSHKCCFYCVASELSHGDPGEGQSDQRAGGEGGHAGGRGQCVEMLFSIIKKSIIRFISIKFVCAEKTVT